jgi:hypothetical protein
MGDYVTDPKKIERWKKRLPHDNPYLGRIFDEIVIRFRAPQDGVSQDRFFLWTGSGLKPDERVSKPKTFETPVAAVKELKRVVVPHVLDYKAELSPFIKGWSAMANVQAADGLPPGFEGFDTSAPPDTNSALLKQFESARKGRPFRLGSEQYEVRVNHGYVSDVPGMPRGSRGYMVLVFDAKLSPQERAAAKGGGTTTMVLDTATDKVYLYPWATTRTDGKGVPKGKPAAVIGSRPGPATKPVRSATEFSPYPAKGGRYYGRRAADSKVVAMKPAEAEKVANRPASKSGSDVPTDWLAVWWVPPEYVQVKEGPFRIKSGAVKPLWDWGRGRLVQKNQDVVKATKRVDMNSAQEKDIIRVLVRANKETLAKSFAKSRGYRVAGSED